MDNAWTSNPTCANMTIIFFPREVRDKNKELSIYTQNSWIVDICLILLYLTKCGHCSKKSLKIYQRGNQNPYIGIAWDCEVWCVVLGLKIKKMRNKKQYIYFICTFMCMFHRSLFALFLLAIVLSLLLRYTATGFSAWKQKQNIKLPVSVFVSFYLFTCYFYKLSPLVSTPNDTPPTHTHTPSDSFSKA
jgi:hypothetical protein